jgi:membrane protein required for colicin V production
MPHFNIADLALALIWLFCSFRGYLRGLVKEVGSLAAIATGFYCAGAYHKLLAPRLAQYISGNYAGTAAYLIIFTAALFGVWFLTLAASGVVKITMTEWADRFFGGGFGLAKGFLITAAVLFLIQLAVPHPDFLTGSRLVPVLERISSQFVRYIPPGINDKLRAWAQNIPSEAAKTVIEKKMEKPEPAEKTDNQAKSSPAKAEGTLAKPSEKATAATAAGKEATAAPQKLAPAANAEKRHD